MKIAEDIIIRPYITEKSYENMAEGKYTFIVDYRANKTEIKKAVERLFNVKVLSVNTVNCKPKEKRLGVHIGKTAKWKKAIVKIDTNPQPVTYLDKEGKPVTTAKKYKTEIEEFGGAQ